MVDPRSDAERALRDEGGEVTGVTYAKPDGKLGWLDVPSELRSDLNEWLLRKSNLGTLEPLMDALGNPL